MSDRWIIVRNWGEFQHYKDRDPSWIKNYTRLLHDEAYLRLSWQQRGVLHGLWMEYAASDGQLPDDTSSITRRLGDRVLRVTLESLNQAGFISFSASRPPRISSSLEKLREEKKELKAPPPNPNGQKRKPAPEEIPSMVDAVTACQHFIAGRAWDDSYDEPSMREEFGRIERGRRTHGTINPAELAGLLEQWQATRQDRYGIKTDL